MIWITHERERQSDINAAKVRKSEKETPIGQKVDDTKGVSDLGSFQLDHLLQPGELILFLNLLTFLCSLP